MGDEELDEVDDWVWVPSSAELSLRATCLQRSSDSVGTEHLSSPASQLHPSSGHVAAGEDTLTSALNEQWSSPSAATFATRATSMSADNFFSTQLQGEGLAMLSSSVCIPSISLA